MLLLLLLLLLLLQAKLLAQAQAQGTRGSALGAAAGVSGSRSTVQGLHGRTTLQGGGHGEGGGDQQLQVGWSSCGVFPRLSSGWLEGGSVTSAPVAALPRQALM